MHAMVEWLEEQGEDARGERREQDDTRVERAKVHVKHGNERQKCGMHSNSLFV
jgi:hypothetical protein